MKLMRIFVAAHSGSRVCEWHFAAQREILAPRSVKGHAFLGGLWDGKGKLWTNAIVIVGRATRISQRYLPMQSGDPGRARRSSTSSKYTGLPGLIDVHTQHDHVIPTRLPASQC